jgi:hypothetical protein
MNCEQLEGRQSNVLNEWFGTERLGGPSASQLEIVFIGPGYGESICIHIGSGRWIIVDSCRIPGTKVSAPVNYLQSLGVDVARQVHLVVATHWHDDHCGGLAETFTSCRGAQFCLSSVLTNKEFQVFVDIYQSRPLSLTGSLVSEFSTILNTIDAEGSKRLPPRRASQGRVLYSVPAALIAHGLHCQITALSPSDLSEHDFLQRIGQLIPGHGDTKRPAPTVQPNDASVALWLNIGGRQILLGADLEEVAGDRKGWRAILLADNCPTGRASVFKVPHHGSVSGHNTGIWHEKLCAHPLTVTTPWARGSQSLPSPSDISRIVGLTQNPLVTSLPKPTRSPKRHPAVERELRESKIKVRRISVGLGAIRLRTAPDNPHSPWCIELAGSATSL